MRFQKTVSIAVGLGLAAAATVASAETWRFGLEEIEGSVQYEYAAQFKKLVEEKSDGDINVKLFPYGTIGTAYKDLYDAIQGGAIQLSFGSGFLGGTVPESQLFSLNFILPEDQLLTAKVLNSDAFLKSDLWQKSFAKRGLVPVAEVPEGYQVWTANREIHDPKDMDGLAIRVMDNSLLRATYQAYGAAPTTIAYGELYSALQQGQVDANIQPVFAHEEMNFYEVQDYMIFAKQAQFVATVLANKDWYKGLSDKTRNMIDEVTGELVSYTNDVQQKLNTERLKTIKKNSDIKIIRLSDEQRNEFRKLAKPVRQTFVDDVGERGGKLLDLLLNEFKKAENK